MRHSTTVNKKLATKVLIIAFWVGIWEIGSSFIGSDILLASPFQVAGRLLELIRTTPFWFTIINSFLRIITGFTLGLVVGLTLAILSYASPFIKEVFEPVIGLIKSIPVASFIILLLVWISSKQLSVVVSFLIMLPVAFSNIYHSLCNTDKKMVEMSKVFNVPMNKRVRYLYFNAVMPGFLSAVSIGIGFCYKSGVAAEVIGICKNTIGEAIYTAKIHLETVDVLAWTIVIVVLSNVTERATKRIVAKMQKGNRNDTQAG